MKEINIVFKTVPLVVLTRRIKEIDSSFYYCIYHLIRSSLYDQMSNIEPWKS